MKQKIEESVIIKLLLILIILFFFNFNSILYNIFLNCLFSYAFEIKKIEKYFILCNSERLINRNKFKRIKFPKVSIISPVHNREKFILRFIRSIQNQKFNEIEIIFIDDFSRDKSIKLIEKYQEEDERIILIKNKINKGTLISRNIGALNSRGEYLVFSDPDDILAKNIINFCYNFIKTKNYEMLRFNLCSDHKLVLKSSGLANKIITQPKLSTFLFYAKNRLRQIDYIIANKFIKRKAFIRALNSVNDYYLNLYMNFAEDGLINYLLYRNAKSLFYIKKIGYYYIKNNQSITESNLNDNKIRAYFYNLKLIFEYSKNNNYEKKMASTYFRAYFSRINDDLLKNIIKKDCKFYNKIIEMYLNCEFISHNNKRKLKSIKC